MKTFLSFPFHQKENLHSGNNTIINRTKIFISFLELSTTTKFSFHFLCSFDISYNYQYNITFLILALKKKLRLNIIEVEMFVGLLDFFH
jgi:hypothetical protein